MFLLVATAAEATAQHGPVFTVVPDSGIEHVPTYGGPAKGYISEMGGSGSAWIDIDRDGHLDLLLVNALTGPADNPVGASLAGLAGDPTEGGGHRLFHGRDGRFVDVTAHAQVGDRVWGNGVAVADYDNDGLLDLFVTAIGPDRLYRNNGDGTFSATMVGVEDEGWGASAAFTDWDEDGNLDLYVTRYVTFEPDVTPTLGEGLCLYLGIEVFCGPEGLRGERDLLYRNLGDGSFEPWAEDPVDDDRTYGFALVATDCDNDGRADLYVASDSTMNLLYRHSGDKLEDWSLFSGAGFSGSGQEQAGMGATAADFDQDGDFDLYVTNFQNDYNALYRNRGDCLFDDISERLGIAGPTLPFMGWATLFVDVDGDADQDLFVVNGHIYPQIQIAGLEPYGQRNLILLNELTETGEAGFVTLRAGEGGPGLNVEVSSRSATYADHDNDGDYDLMVTNIAAAPTLLENQVVATFPALRLTLIGRDSARDAYGARVLVESAGKRQLFELRHSDGYLGSNDTRILVYLPSGRADVVEIRWSATSSTRLEDVEPGWVIIDQQRGVIASRDQ